MSVERQELGSVEDRLAENHEGIASFYADARLWDEPLSEEDTEALSGMISDLFDGEEGISARHQIVGYNSNSFAYEVSGDEAVAVMPDGEDTYKFVHAKLSDDISHQANYIAEVDAQSGIELDSTHHQSAIEKAWEAAESDQLRQYKGIDTIWSEKNNADYTAQTFTSAPRELANLTAEKGKQTVRETYDFIRN